LSTLTDLFSRSIGFWKKAVIVERTGGLWNLLRAEEKLPLGEKAILKHYDGGETLETILEKEAIVKENVYYIIPPTIYYRNIIHFPFTDRQRIERVISYEVRDYLPSEEIDSLTDFYLQPALNYRKNGWSEVAAFTVEKGEVENILLSAGKFRENIKAIIPYDIAMLSTVNFLVERRNALIIDIQKSGVYLQYVRDSLVRDGFLILVSKGNQFEDILKSRIVMMLKAYEYPPVFINTRKSAGSELSGLLVDLLNSMDVQPRPLPIQQLEKELGKGKELERSEMVAVYGALRMVNAPFPSRVNLLKGEFKPHFRGYLRVRDFVVLFSLLTLLLAISITNLFLDTGTKKAQIDQLKMGIAEVSQRAFGKPTIELEEAADSVKELDKKISLVKSATDRNYSAIVLFEELTMALPSDVVMEYTDLVIEQDHIMLAGKTRTFSDIDRIKEGLKRSEYFSGVEVSNTGTTGSTEGFMVSFLFDIDFLRER